MEAGLAGRSMKKSESTLHDVARRVGVSPRTVSRVVNGESGFSEATAERVQAAIEELGYRPNLLARSLITKRSNTIGLIGVSLTDPFFPEVAEGVQREASELGLTMFFATTDDEPDRLTAALDTMISRAVDGIIAFPVQADASPLVKAADDGVNLVIVHPAEPLPGINSISSDLKAGAIAAVEHLQTTGRSRIAYLGTSTRSPNKRATGYIAAVEGEPRIVTTAPTAEGGLAGTREILKRWPDIDAVFAYNDIMALAAIQVLNESGRAVPNDVAVVGFDNIELSSYVSPPLTTMDMDHVTLGAKSVRLLHSLIENPGKEPEQIVHPVTLQVRRST